MTSNDLLDVEHVSSSSIVHPSCMTPCLFLAVLEKLLFCIWPVGGCRKSSAHLSGNIVQFWKLDKPFRRFVASTSCWYKPLAGFWVWEKLKFAYSSVSSVDVTWTGESSGRCCYRKKFLLSFCSSPSLAPPPALTCLLSAFCVAAVTWAAWAITLICACAEKNKLPERFNQTLGSRVIRLFRLDQI